MNCKPDDLAVIVFSQHAENIGGWVTVVERCPDSELGDWHVRTLQPLKGSDWANGDYVTAPAGPLGIRCDRNLRPIRGQRTPDPVHSPISEEAGA